MRASINNRRMIIISILASILIIPFIAMQFTNEVNWSFFDFAVATILLTSIGLAIDLTLDRIQTSKMRIMIIAVIILLGMIIWAELAVGIFGTPFAGN